jgi:hypothetical protein
VPEALRPHLHRPAADPERLAAPLTRPGGQIPAFTLAAGTPAAAARAIDLLLT